MPDVFIAKDKAKKKNTAVPSDPAKPDHVEKLKNHTHNPLSAFCFYPHKVSFLDQKPDETVVLLVRRHVITNVPWLLLVLIMIFAPLILQYFPLLNFLPLRFQTVAISVWYLLTLAIFIENFLSWFFSVNIVTTKRVIDVNFDSLIYRKITDAELAHIEDVTVQMGSVVRTLFGYGDIVIQTAAEIPNVTFEAVPHPDEVERILSDLRSKIE